jgi:hypothetical protein
MIYTGILDYKSCVSQNNLVYSPADKSNLNRTKTLIPEYLTLRKLLPVTSDIITIIPKNNYAGMISQA